MVYPQCGHGRVSLNIHFLRIVHHRYHTYMVYMVYPQCGYGHGPSNSQHVRTVHHKYHI